MYEILVAKGFARDEVGEFVKDIMSLVDQHTSDKELVATGMDLVNFKEALFDEVNKITEAKQRR